MDGGGCTTKHTLAPSQRTFEVSIFDQEQTLLRRLSRSRRRSNFQNRTCKKILKLEWQVSFWHAANTMLNCEFCAGVQTEERLTAVQKMSHLLQLIMHSFAPSSGKIENPHLKGYFCEKTDTFKRMRR